MFARKQLGTLQPTHPGHPTPPGGKPGTDAIKTKKTNLENSRGKRAADSVYRDPTPPAKRHCSALVQTDPLPPCASCGAPAGTDGAAARKKTSDLSNEETVTSQSSGNATVTSQSAGEETVTSQPSADEEAVIPPTDAAAVIEAMTSERPTETHWYLLAERRRLALAEALAENERLSDDNERLRGEMKGMEELVAEAKVLAQIVENAMDVDSADEAGSDVSEDSGAATSEPSEPAA